LLRHVTSQTLDTNELLNDILVSRYPQPIHDYIEFMTAQPEVKRHTSEKFTDLAAWLQKEVLRVKYKVDRYGDISITPLRSKTELGLHLGSSTAKTFFGLWSYLNHLAQPGDCLMIDEPELNLHPLNQRNIARLLAEIVNRGIRVVVSTHSDYMVREWGNLVMLGKDFPEREAIAKRHGLHATQWLAAEKVTAYEFHAEGIVQMALDAKSGIRTPLFDESIEQLNAAAQEIYFAIQDAQPAPVEETSSVIRKTKGKK
jgi:predicted ATP-binding protein involved in virulence